MRYLHIHAVNLKKKEPSIYLRIRTRSRYADFALLHTSIVLVGRRRFSLAQTDSLLMRMRSVASDELNQMMQRRMSQENPIRASETEFVQRLQKLVILAVNRLIYHGAALVLALPVFMSLLRTNRTCFSSFRGEPGFI